MSEDSEGSDPLQLPILPPDQRPPEPPEPPPPSEDLDYRMAPEPSGPPLPLQLHNSDGGAAPEPDYLPPPPPPQPEAPPPPSFAPLPPPPFPPSGFGPGYLGGLPPPSLRDMFVAAPAPPPSSSSSSSSAVPPPGYQDPPFPHGGVGLFSGDKDHRFEYNHSPLPDGLAHPAGLHGYGVGRQDGPPPPQLHPHPPGQAWGSPSPSHPAGAPPFPPGFLPHMNAAALRGRGLPF